jgi:hypothetical protein
MAEIEYQRLTRSKRRHKFVEALSRSSSLWLGEDHLLCIDSNHFAETYKRFRFRDIQAITIRKTRKREFWNFVLSLTILLFIGILLTSSDTYWWVGTITVLGVPLIFNNILGPTCTAYLRTAVQLEELPSLNRIGRADKVLGRIRPLIAAAQGELSSEDASARLHELVESSSTGPAEQQQTTVVASGPLNLSS